MREDVYEWFLHTFNERDSYITKGVGYKWVLNNIAKNEKRWPGLRKLYIQWANEINQSKQLTGIFRLHDKLYGDGIKRIKSVVGKDDNMLHHINAIINDPSSFSDDLKSFIDNHKDHPQIKALINNPDRFIKLLGNGLSVNDIVKYIDINQLSDESKYDIIVKQPNITKHFKNLSEKFLAGMIKDGYYKIIGYVKEPSDRLQMIAIDHSLNAMAYIQDPSGKVKAFYDHVKKNPGDDAGIKTKIGEPRPA